MLYRRLAITDPERRAGYLHEKKKKKNLKKRKEKEKERIVPYGSVQYTQEAKIHANSSYVRETPRLLRGALQRSMNLCIADLSCTVRSP